MTLLLLSEIVQTTLKILLQFISSCSSAVRVFSFPFPLHVYEWAHREYATRLVGVPMKFAMSVFNSFLLKPKILLTLPHFTPSLLKCLHSAQFIYGLRTYGRHFCALWQNIVTPTSGTECLVLRCNFFSRVPSRHTKSLGGMLPNDLVQQLKNNRG